MAPADRPAAPAHDPPPWSGLDDERDFALRSLLDLEAEHDAGDLGEDDYLALRDVYTARAAVALRAISGEESSATGEPAGGEVGRVEVDVDGTMGGPADGGPASAAGPWRKWLLLALGVVAVAGGAAWAVVASSATRLPGQEITGQVLGSQAEEQTLLAAQAAADKGDDVTAVKDFQQVLNTDPNQPDALTGEGWLLAQTQQPALLQQGLTMLLSAERAAPTYAPAHVYRGISLLSEGDYAGAIPELQWYLAHQPDPQLAPRVRQALQQAEAKLAATKKR
jgi:tetratricopeptide (TPR) repeat protein